MLGQIFLTFEEHLVSLSVADCAVNTSLTTSRARFHRHNIWLCHLITIETEENSLTRSLCCLCYTLLSSSRCLQDATVNVAQMLCLWETQKPGSTDRQCFPNSTVLSGIQPVCASRGHPTAWVCCQLALTGDSTAEDVEVRVVQATYSFSANILEQSDVVSLAACGPKSIF